jgi:hypothetical protein
MLGLIRNPALTMQGGASASALREALARAEAAEARVKLLEQQADNLGRQVALLEERLGRGEYNAATTRVLHFKYSPEAELAREARDARVAQLESENGALKQHIQRLEQAQQVGSGGGGQCTPQRVVVVVVVGQISNQKLFSSEAAHLDLWAAWNRGGSMAKVLASPGLQLSTL